MANIIQCSISIIATLMLFGCMKNEAMQPSRVNPTEVATAAMVNYHSQANDIAKNQEWATPTAYSTTLIKANYLNEIGHTNEWRKTNIDQAITGSVEYLMTDKALESCKQQSVDHILFPYIQAQGFSVNTIQEAQSLPYSDKEKLNKIMDEDSQVVNSASTYLINCMVAKGYYFPKADSK